MAVIYAFIKGTFKNVQSKLFVRKKYSNHRRNRHYFSANGPFLLLPLALKWGLFLLGVISILPCLGSEGANAASLTVEVPQSPLSVTVSADGVAKESSQANVKVTSDAYWGYTLSVKSDSGDGSLMSGANRLKTTTDNAADLDNNSWGFKFGKDTVSGNYHKGPTMTAATQLDETTGKVGQKEENSYAFAIGAKVDDAQAAGIYTGQFTFTLTANTVDYTINYDGNGGSGGPATTTGKSIEQTVQLASNTPTNSDKTFIGWCSQQPTDKGGCKGEVYYPSDNYTLSSSGNNLTLYALWDGIEMQNWEGCETLRMSTTKQEYQITLVDSRDKKPYYVAKLADDNCWMTENLDYDIVASVPLTAETTDLGFANADGSPNANGIGDYKWIPEKSTYTIENSIWDSTYNNARSFDPGDYCWNGKIYTTNPGGIQVDSSSFQERFVECVKHQLGHNQSVEVLHHHIGNYYNYGAAVARNDTTNPTSGNNQFKTSICPSGWQLPMNDENNPSFKELFNIDNTTKAGPNGNVHLGPYYLPYTGFWSNSKTISNLGFRGLFAAGVMSDSEHAYFLDIRGDNGANYQSSGWIRHHGLSIRCVTRQ